jgi:hypothetical protein
MANILIDLEAFAESDQVKQKIPRLRDIIRKASNTQSCYVDLHEAQELIELLKRRPTVNEKVQIKERDLISSSLMTSAVILYARATSTSGSKGERGSIDIRSELDSERLFDHNLIVSVRNKAIAHVYTKQDLQNVEWHRQRIFLVQNDIGIRPAVSAKRVHMDAAVALAVDRQIPIAKKSFIKDF